MKITRTPTAIISSKKGDTVIAQGWVHAIRSQKDICFIILRDITGKVQVVTTPSLAKDITLESVIEVFGQVIAEPQSPGGFEVHAKKITVLSLADPTLPIPVVEKSGQTDQQIRLDWRWIDLRKPKNLLIFQIWTRMEHSFRQWWIDNGFIEIHSPKLMNTPSEGASELFKVPYFTKTAYLAQSPQFYKQMAMASGFERVFEIGPVFRANPSFTSRHDTEFTSYDMEVSFIQSHQDIVHMESELLVFVLRDIKASFGDQIKSLFKAEIIIPEIPFPQIPMAQVKKLLKKRGVPSEKEGDLSPEEERQLAEYIYEDTGHEFVFVTEYPTEVRPFYHMRVDSDTQLTKSFDLVWKGLEITTGAQREHRYDPLVHQATEKGLNLSQLAHYFDFFKYGCPPHGGLGFGPSRFIMKMLNLPNVREVTYLYRGINRLTP